MLHDEEDEIEEETEETFHDEEEEDRLSCCLSFRPIRLDLVPIAFPIDFPRRPVHDKGLNAQAKMGT